MVTNMKDKKQDPAQLTIFEFIKSDEEFMDWFFEEKGLDELDKFQYRIWNKRPALRSRLIICTYDISETRQRNVVVKCLKSSGMHRVQKSVFMAEISERAYKLMRAQFKSMEAEFESQDHIMLMPFTEQQLIGMHVTGKSLDVPYLLNRKRVLMPGLGKLV